MSSSKGLIRIVSGDGRKFRVFRQHLLTMEYFKAILGENWKDQVIELCCDGRSLQIIFNLIRYGPKVYNNNELTNSEKFMVFTDARYLRLPAEILSDLILEEPLIRRNNIKSNNSVNHYNDNIRLNWHCFTYLHNFADYKLIRIQDLQITIKLKAKMKFIREDWDLLILVNGRYHDDDLIIEQKGKLINIVIVSLLNTYLSTDTQISLQYSLGTLVEDCVMQLACYPQISYEMFQKADSSES